MRAINLDTWSRRDHFNFFNAFDHPHFGFSANVDISRFYPYVKQNSISFSVAFVYLIARTANAIPEFRLRIRSESIVEHDLVHPSYTILVKEDIFSFCTLDYEEDFSAYAGKALDHIAFVKDNPSIGNVAGRDDLLYLTALPWLSFTSFMHPMNLNPPDSVPRFAWGKYFEEGGLLKMPFGVQAHHALMDGIHIGRYYEKIQEYLFHPDLALK